MYKTDWDRENNLLLLRKENAFLHNEYRPVFSAELKNMGFDAFFSFGESDTAPILWASHYHYWYRGVEVAKLEENGCLQKPDIRILDESILGCHLDPIDTELWFRKNRELMEQLVQDTLLRIYRVYMEWKDKTDYIQVAYSGGKDSMVLLDLVKRIIPHDRFFVAWIDSGMEQPTSLAVIEKEAARCRELGIDFLANHALLNAREAWELIGPPSFDDRWCCSVLQSVPNTLQLRDYLGRRDARGLLFLGNRADESAQRMKSRLVGVGVKHGGQVDVNGIINWSSLEVFLYLMMNGLEMNRAYIEGFLRVGCLVCPRASNLGIACAYSVQKEQMEPFLDVVREAYRGSFDSEESLEQFINLGEWRFRKGSKSTKYHLDYREYRANGRIHLEMGRPRTRWEIWMKTIGELRRTENNPEAPEESRYAVSRGGRDYPFSIREADGRMDVSVEEHAGEDFLQLFRNVFRRAIACVGCRTCEVNCPYGHLHFEGEEPVIDEGCLHCAQCHQGIHACYAFDSWAEKEKLL